MIEKMRSKRLFIALAGLLVLSMLVAACAAAPVSAQTPAADAGEHVITVSGTGQASGRPDVAYIELGIDVSNRDVGVAIEEANSTMDEVRQALIDQGVAEENLQTTQFNVWAEEIRDPETGTPQGERLFHVVNLLRVKVSDIESVGDVISAGLDAGANTVNNLSFTIDDSAELESEARVDAVADARERAEQLADALGVQLGAPVSISETTGGGGVIIERAVMQDGMGGGASISEGQLTVGVTVNVSYLIEQ